MVRGAATEQALPSGSRLDELLRPDPATDGAIREFLQEHLGGVLPSTGRRGFDWYYRDVVLGKRALDALRVISRHRTRTDLPVLDIGTGLGTFALLCLRTGVDAVGIELGREEVHLARERAASAGVDPEAFRLGRGERLPFPDGTFSAALLHDVLEHVADWRAVVAEARRVLAPEGVLYVKGPSYTFRFLEPHYHIPWLPLLPRPIAKAYLRRLDRDVSYFDSIHYRRRGEVLSELRSLGFELAFPRREKLEDLASISRPWVRRSVGALGTTHGLAWRLAKLLAENPFQWVIDVVARRPAH